MGINEAYASEPWWYDLRGLLILTFAYQQSVLHQINFFARKMKGHHLEAAIGTGTLFKWILLWARLLRIAPSQVTAFDYAERMLQGAQKRFKKEKKMELVRADIAALPFENESFDSASIVNAVHCLPDPLKGFQELRRVLKKDGTLTGNVLLNPKGFGPLDKIAIQINEWGTKKGILNRPYKVSEVRSFLQQSGFQILEEKTVGNCYEFVAKP